MEVRILSLFPHTPHIVSFKYITPLPFLPSSSLSPPPLKPDHPSVEDLVTFQTEAKMLLETPGEKGKKRRLADLEPPQRLAQEMYKVLQRRTGLTEKDLWQ